MSIYTIIEDEARTINNLNVRGQELREIFQAACDTMKDTLYRVGVNLSFDVESNAETYCKSSSSHPAVITKDRVLENMIKVKIVNENSGLTASLQGRKLAVLQDHRRFMFRELTTTSDPQQTFYDMDATRSRNDHLNYVVASHLNLESCASTTTTEEQKRIIHTALTKLWDCTRTLLTKQQMDAVHAVCLPDLRQPA